VDAASPLYGTGLPAPRAVREPSQATEVLVRWGWPAPGGVGAWGQTMCNREAPPFGATRRWRRRSRSREDDQAGSSRACAAVGWIGSREASDYCDQGTCFDEPRAVGRYWIEWVRSVTPGPCCEAVSYRYQNISTGAITADPTTARTVPDLNLPGLVRDVCAPLQCPPHFDDHADGRGTLQFDGSFAISSSALPPKPDFPQSAGQSSYLERCGSKLHLRLPSQLSVWNETAILTGFDQRQGNGFKRTVSITGLKLPGLRPLRIRKPLALQKGGALPSVEGTVLTTRHLYLLDRPGRVWMGPAQLLEHLSPYVLSGPPHAAGLIGGVA
jgi:hypothetical protein